MGLMRQFSDPKRPTSNKRFWMSMTMLIAVLIGYLGLGGNVVQASTPVEYGYRDFKFPSGVGGTNEPTGGRAESKLWFANGKWWASMWSSAGNANHIHRLDLAAQNWVDTGVAIDNRPLSRADALWDGQYLYIASHIWVTAGVPTSTAEDRGKLFRYQYDSVNQKFILDSGFPVEITRGKSETLVIDKDSSGQLWATYVESLNVMVNHSLNGNDRTWGNPFVLPVGSSAQVKSDDISSVITYNQHVGIMWSSQKTPYTMFFAVHPVGAPDSNWTKARAYTKSADDHINLKMLESDSSGNVYAAIKSADTNGSELLVLLVCKNNLKRCKSDTDWVSYPVYEVNPTNTNPTRPVILIDTTQRQLYFFATVDDSSGNQGVYYKQTSLDNIQFNKTTLGQPIIRSSTDRQVNNVTSTKQNLDASTGLVILASDSYSKYYLHNYISLSGAPVPSPTPTNTLPPPPPPSPTATATVNPGPGPTPTNTPTPTVTPVAGLNVPIKDITFENGILVDPVNGADRLTGGVVLDSNSSMKGVYSARVPNVGNAYLDQSFTGANDVYTSFYLKINSLPSSDTRIFYYTNAGTMVGNLYLLANGALRLRNGSTTIANSSPLSLNTLYRVGFRQKAGSGGDAIMEAYLAAGDAAFGAPFASLSTGIWVTPADRIRIGATLSTTFDAYFDDIRLDSAAMPGPSTP